LQKRAKRLRSIASGRKRRSVVCVLPKQTKHMLLSTERMRQRPLGRFKPQWTWPAPTTIPTSPAGKPPSLALTLLQSGLGTKGNGVGRKERHFTFAGVVSLVTLTAPGSTPTKPLGSPASSYSSSRPNAA